jgi:hypothetical protein
VTDDLTNPRKSKAGSIHKMLFDNDHMVRPSGTTSPRVHENSISAIESLDPAAKARRAQQIFEYIKTNGGATCWEIEMALGLLHQSASSTITKLRNAGHLVDTGERRPTITGRMATVWGAVAQ